MSLILPAEIYTDKIIPFFVLKCDVRSLCAFGLTVKFFSRCIGHVAQQEGDINLAGERCQFPYDENTTTIMACIIQILKITVLRNYPKLSSNLLIARSKLQEVGKNPDDIGWLLRFVDENKGLGNDISTFATDVLTAIVPFDFQTQKIPPYYLSLVLTEAIKEGKIDLAQLMIAHPTCTRIKSKNLCSVLVSAVKLNSLGLIRTIFALPNADHFDVHGAIRELQYTLDGVLCAAIEVNNPEIIAKVVSHRSAKNMLIGLDATPGEYHGLKAFLHIAVETNDPKVIAAVLHHPRIIELSEEDLYKAGVALIAHEDQERFYQMWQLLEQQHFTLTEFVETFGKLNTSTRFFLFAMLCKTHGCPSGDFVNEGPEHAIYHPESLLHIIRRLIYSC